MSKLEFLEVTQNFTSYYKTLCDVNYYLSSDFDQEKLQAASQVMTKLILCFICTNGSTFREWDHEQYEKEYQMFQDDFLTIIQNSGENNVDFDDFAALIDEVIGIANHRMNTLRKIKKTKQETAIESEEIVGQVMESEVELTTDVINDEINIPIIENNINEEVEESSDQVENIRTDVEGVKITLGQTSRLVEDVHKDPDDVGIDFEEVNESDDIFHLRPRRKRYR
jgi:hypothetical protein